MKGSLGHRQNEKDTASGACAVASDTATEVTEPTALGSADHIAAHRICPGCGTELIDRGCKMRCLRCGFFLDCSDG